MQKRLGENLLDVSASMNPFVPDFSCAYDPAVLIRYPDDTYTSLKEKIGSVFSRDPAEICVGNGSAELIRVFCSVAAGRGTTCRIDAPTFGEYALSARLSGAEVISGADTGCEADIRFICNPNNPTGILQPRSAMCAALTTAAASGTMLFVDEAFMELAARDESISDIRSDNLFVMRSITKCFSVPGLRFGFGFGSPELIEKIETARTPWTVNAFAEQYTMAALDHYAELTAAAAKISAERDWYFRELTAAGLSYYPSQVNYITINLRCPAEKIAARMAEHGILVRDCTSFGLPDCIRVAVERHEINRRVMETLSACLH